MNIRVVWLWYAKDSEEVVIAMGSINVYSMQFIAFVIGIVKYNVMQDNNYYKGHFLIF